MVKFILIALVSFSFSGFTLARASDSFELIRGFHSPDGHVLVEVNSKNVPSGNVFFLGDSKKLNQLELTWDDSIGSERSLTYITYEGGESSEVTLSPDGALVENGLHGEHPHIDKMTMMAPAELKLPSSASLRMLPEIWKSRYLFQSSSSGEYLLVKEPIFNFHGNYRVWIGTLAGFKEISVRIFENWKEGVAGKILFQSGGGLFIPKMSEILSTLRPSQAEMPTFVRPNTSSSLSLAETLKVPKLSPAQLARLGFVRERNGTLSAER